MKNKYLKKIEENISHYLNAIKEEAQGTKESSIIIGNYVKTGKITKEEELIVKKQLVDSLKMIGVIVPLILIPGASILMPLIITFAEKHNIELLPSSFKKKKK